MRGMGDTLYYKNIIDTKLSMKVTYLFKIVTLTDEFYSNKSMSLFV